MINAPRGTKDLLPQEALKWQYIERKAKEIFSLYCYGEIRTPIFEATELFSRGVGEATDIVEKEMYTFQDRSGRSLTLRPEGTASVIRAYVEHKLYVGEQSNTSGSLSGSATGGKISSLSGSGIGHGVCRLYYTGPFFRYERPQAGRFRQHYQIGAEAIGSQEPALDAEIIGMAIHLFESLGMTGLEVKINSIGCPDCRPSYKKTLVHYFNEKHALLCFDCKDRLLRNPLRILDCKNQQCIHIASEAPKNSDYLCDECGNHFERVQQHLSNMQVTTIVAPNLVRGLDYYTKTVFEVVSSFLGAQSSVGGGGRYDGLVELLGGPQKGAVGFACGIERIIMVMEACNAFPINISFPLLFIAPLGKEAMEWAVSMIWRLRKKKLKVNVGLSGKGLSAQLKEGASQKAKYVLIVGEDELASNKLILRDMEFGSQEVVLVGNYKDMENCEEKILTVIEKSYTSTL